MLKALLKVQGAIFLSIFTGAARSKKQKSKASLILFAALMVYAFGCLGFLFWHIFDTIKEPFVSLGLDWLYFTLVSIMAFAIMFIASVFTTKAQLFEAKDNERLLAMPIPPGTILLSRMVTLYILNFVLGLLELIPALMVWGIGNFSALGLTAYILEIFLLPLLGIAVSSLFAWLIALITNALPKKNIVTVVLYFIFFGGYMIVCMRMNTYLTALAGMGEQLAGSLGAVAPLYWLGAAPAGLGAGAVLGMLAVCLVPFAVLYILLSRSFLHLITTKKGEKRVEYKQQSVEAVSPRKALLRNEFRHLLACPTWMLNGGFGPVLMTVGAVVLAVKGAMLREAIAQIGAPADVIPIILLLAVMALAGLAPFSNCAVSLEGKHYWLARSAPVETYEILYAKQRMAELLTMIPAVLFTLVAMTVLKLDNGNYVVQALCALWFARLSCRIGLFEDLRHGRLDWNSEAQAVKQGMSVLFTMCINFALIAAVGILWFAVFSGRVEAGYYLCGVLVVFAVLDLLLDKWMRTKGVQRFEDFG